MAEGARLERGTGGGTMKKVTLVPEDSSVWSSPQYSLTPFP